VSLIEMGDTRARQIRVNELVSCASSPSPRDRVGVSLPPRKQTVVVDSNQQSAGLWFPLIDDITDRKNSRPMIESSCFLRCLTDLQQKTCLEKRSEEILARLRRMGNDLHLQLISTTSRTVNDTMGTTRRRHPSQESRPLIKATIRDRHCKPVSVATSLPCSFFCSEEAEKAEPRPLAGAAGRDPSAPFDLKCSSCYQITGRQYRIAFVAPSLRDRGAKS